MPPFRILLCTLVLPLLAPACDTPSEPPEPTIEIGEKVEKLSDEVARTRAEAQKRVNTAATVNAPAKDAGLNSKTDAR